MINPPIELFEKILVAIAGGPLPESTMAAVKLGRSNVDEQIDAMVALAARLAMSAARFEERSKEEK